MAVPDKEMQMAATPESVLRLLREGNYRFANNLRVKRNLLEQVAKSRDGQYPLAIVLNCIDSRTPTELLFDQGIGGLVGIRVAGSVINPDVLGSMEFASKIAGAKLIVVLGHTNCGAIKGACDNVQLGNLTELLHKIQPAVELENTVTTDRTAKNTEFVEKVAEIHVRHSLGVILEQSQVLREMINGGNLGLIGGMYNVETGIVNFYVDTFMVGGVKQSAVTV